MSYSIQQPTDGSLQIIETTTGDVVFYADVDTSDTSHTISTAINTVARTDTTAKNLFLLPAGAIPLDVILTGRTASNAATTATVSVGVTGTATFYVNAADVKGNNGKISTAGALGLGAVPATLQVIGTYAETGTASSTGGPWTVTMLYYVP
jgi:hypothetical protein